jgi:hypothetical protein
MLSTIFWSMNGTCNVHFIFASIHGLHRLRESPRLITKHGTNRHTCDDKYKTIMAVRLTEVRNRVYRIPDILYEYAALVLSGRNVASILSPTRPKILPKRGS